jgi:cytochrome P450
MIGLVDMTRDSLQTRILGWGDEVDVSHEMRCIVNDVMFRFFVNGHRLGVDGPEDVDGVAQCFANVERGLEHRVFPLVPTWLQFGFLGSLKKVSRIVKRLVTEPHRCPVDHSPSGMLRKKLPSDEAVWKEIRTTMGAGATTGHLLSWVFHLIAEHPDVQSRLRDEIFAMEPSPSLSALEAMPYLTAVIQEGLRLYPPAPFLIRQSRFNRADLVFVSVWAMHRNPEDWEQPDEFKPERWLENPSPSSFVPFGLGPRVCIGKRFAWVEARVLIFEILRRYELSCGLGERPEPVFTVLTRPSRNIWVTLTPLENECKYPELKRFII